MEQRAAAPRADHQVGLDGRITQHFEQANSVDRPGRARNGDDESLHTGSIYRGKAASGEERGWAPATKKAKGHRMSDAPFHASSTRLPQLTAP